MNGTQVAESSCPVGTLFDSSSSSCNIASLVTCEGNTISAPVFVNDAVLRAGYVPRSALVCDLLNPANTDCKLVRKKKNKFSRYVTAPTTPPLAVDLPAVDWTAAGYVRPVKYQGDCGELCHLCRVSHSVLLLL